MRIRTYVLVVILGMVLGGLTGAGIVILSPSLPLEGSVIDEHISPATEEQVSIQEEEMGLIGEYRVDTINIIKMHDNRDNVTCWIYRGSSDRGGISCIPDHMLTP